MMRSTPLSQVEIVGPSPGEASTRVVPRAPDLETILSPVKPTWDPASKGLHQPADRASAKAPVVGKHLLDHPQALFRLG